MRKNFALITLIASSLFTINCGTSDESKQIATPATELQNIAITKVTKSSIADFYEATGTVRAKSTTQVAANMLGRIISFSAAEGDSVSKGQLLVEIDSRESRAQMQRAEAGLKEAQAAIIEIERSADAANAGVKTAEANRDLTEVTFGRFKELYARKSASGQEFDEAQAKLKMAESELARSKANVQAIISRKRQVNAKIEQAKAEIANTKIYEGYGRISAPVTGIVVKKFAETGAMASPGQPLISIEDNSQFRLEVAVEESRSNLIRAGNRVNVVIDALGQGETYGTVAEILPTADAASRSFTVKIDIPANPLLKSGLYGLARFPLSQKEAITVPQTAVVERGQLNGVFVVGEDGIARFRIVTLGKVSDGLFEVLSGISEGDDIATSNLDRVKDGVKLR